MIRQHIIATISYSYTAERWPTDIHGERETGPSTFYPNQEGTWTVLAPSIAVATAWAETNAKHMKDFKITNFKHVTPTACIVESTW